MTFILEALSAKHGDSLLLHYGEGDNPAKTSLIVIDGGPGGVYKPFLRPTLEAVRTERFGEDSNESLPVRMVMVSHIDDDHINGILQWFRELNQRQEDSEPLLYDIATLWHNSFDDLLGNEDAEMTASFAASIAAAASGSGLSGMATELVKLRVPGHDIGDGEAITASVLQGRELRTLAKSLGLNINTPFGGLIVAGREGKRKIDIGDGLTFHLIGPPEPRVEALQAEWNLVLKKKGLAEIAGFVDESVFNLSSIVVLAEKDGKRMLLTGDARGDDTLAGLEAEGLFSPGGTIHVDLLKLPHHGSDHNVAPEFFERVTADHYVVSGDGKHGNPEVKTLEMLSAARGNDEFTLYLTNKEDRLAPFFAGEKARGKKYRVIERDPDALSVIAML